MSEATAAEWRATGKNNDHSRLSCSGASRWLQCAASITHVEKLKLKDKPNRAASEGTVAHSVCEDSLRTSSDPWNFQGETREADGIKFEVTDEMVEAVEVYTKYINGLESEFMTDQPFIGIEQKLRLTRLGVDGMDGGTGDCLISNLPRKLLYPIDYKHGMYSVEVKNNPQLKWYGIGALIGLYEGDVDIDQWTVVNVVVQPRSPHTDGPIRYDEIPAIELLAWALVVGVPGGHLVNSDNPPYNPSPDACRFCRGNGNCEAADKYTQEIAVIDFDDFTDKPSDAVMPIVAGLTADQKLKIMMHATMIKKYVEAVSEQVTEEILQGSDEYSDYLKPVRKITRRRFKDNASDLLQSYLDEDDIYDKKIKGIGKLEKVLKDEYDKDMCKTVMDSITEKPEGTITVAPITDRRKPVSLSAQADFTDCIDVTEYEEL